MQGSMMGDIYTYASRVLIWLGPPNDATPEPDIVYDFDPSVKDIQALQRFVHRKWLQRRWAIQEVLQARTALAVCGRYSVEFIGVISRLMDQLNSNSYDKSCCGEGSEAKDHVE